MVRLIILLVVGVLALSFFGISIRAIIESPAGADNLNYLAQVGQHMWAAIVAAWSSFTAWLSEITQPLRFSI